MGVFGSLMPDAPPQEQPQGIPANIMAALAAKLIGSQPQRLPAAPQYDQATEQAAMMPETFANPMVKGAIEGMATLPRRAIENSQYSLDSGTYDPGPTLEAAMLPMGTGAIAGVPVKAGEAVMGAGPIRAYHGSPHDFDKFDLSKIGTGEGAQAYGHGLYFAENEGVARQYEKALSAAKDLPSDVLAKYYEPGQIVRGYSGLDLVKKYDPSSRAVTVRSVDRHGNPTQDLLGLRDRVHTTQPSLAELNQAFKGRGLPEYKPGHMYEVNINADPEHFLDWDKPIAAQSGYINDKLKRVFDQSLEGRDAYQSLIKDRPNSGGGLSGAGIKLGATPEAASGRFNATGIPGIKYLDQGSRAAGEGSRNYVLFNDKLIDILKKYGIAGLPAGAGAASNFGSLAPQEKM